jgi:integrase
MALARLTEIGIRNAKLPERGQITLWDETVKHFGIRISSGGAKTFIVMYGRLRERITIGRFPIISLAQARERAKEILAERVLKKDRLPDITFDEAREIFFIIRRQRNKPSTVYEYERIFERHLLPKLRHRKLADIKPHDMLVLVDKLLKTPSEANHTHCIAQSFFRWAVRRRYLERSPMEGMEKPAKYHPRDRVLTDDELVAVWQAAEKYGYPFGSIVQLLILTGQRRSEIGLLKWSYVNKGQITLPPEIVKNNKAHTFPLGRRGMQILEETPNLGEYVFKARWYDRPFNGWQSCTNTLIKAAGTAHWTLHDLRRTFATNLAALGVPPHIVEKLLNHSEILRGVALIYNRYTFAKECHDAIELWENRLAKLLAPKTIHSQVRAA